MRTIILVEDDPQQSSSIEETIRQHYPEYTVVAIDTEKDFRAYLESSSAEIQLVICDVMIPYQYPEEKDVGKPMPQPFGTFVKAGARCWQEFRKKTDYEHVPFLYFTVLTDKHFDYATHSDTQTHYLQKSGSVKPLMERIGLILQTSEAWERLEEEETERLASSPKDTKKLLAGRNTPLRDCYTEIK